ncbi:MAG: ABC transporter permease [Burkholderiales bacterium]
MNAQRWTRIVYPVVGIVLIVAAWHFYVSVFKVHPAVMPAPGKVLDSIFKDWQLLFRESWTTLLECIYGFTLAVVVGILIAVTVTASRTLNLMFYPILIATQSIPKVAIAPIVLVWFGTGMESKIAIAFIVAFFPMVVDTATGLRATPEDLLDLARSLKCTRWQIFWKIQLPSALPYVFSGAKVAVTLAVIGAVIGEFVGANSGLGNLVLVANAQVNSALVWASLVYLSALGMLLYAVVVIAERFLMPWVDSGHR